MKVCIGMSGGVDSSVAAALLLAAGHEVIGVHMKLHGSSPVGQAGPSACGQDDAIDAQRVADQLGIPLHIVNFEARFQALVITPFVQDYLAGLTPNPCARCNRAFKFGEMLRWAQAQGADALATGHYVRKSDRGLLAEAKRVEKDQSYFLFGIRPESLPHILFPLGERSKPEVRALAAELALSVAQKGESQEVCFISDDNHARFIQDAHPTLDGSGTIVHIDGRELGQHDAYWRFTIGQRRGLNVAVGHRVFVLDVDPNSHTVTIGPGEHLMHQQMQLRDCNWFEAPNPNMFYEVRIRHRGARVPCRIERDGADALISVQLPIRAITKGQAAVVYRGAEVIGGGWITAVL